MEVPYRGVSTGAPTPSAEASAFQLEHKKYLQIVNFIGTYISLIIDKNEREYTTRSKAIFLLIVKIVINTLYDCQ